MYSLITLLFSLCDALTMGCFPQRVWRYKKLSLAKGVHFGISWSASYLIDEADENQSKLFNLIILMQVLIQKCRSMHKKHAGLNRKNGENVL